MRDRGLMKRTSYVIKYGNFSRRNTETAGACVLITLSIWKYLAEYSILLNFQLLPGLQTKNWGPTSNPSGVQRAGSRNVDCVCCYKNPSHAMNYECIEKRQDLLCKSKCKKFLGVSNSLQKVHAPVVFAHTVLAGPAEAHLCELAVPWEGRQMQLTISHNVATTGAVSSQWCTVWLCYCCS